MIVLLLQDYSPLAHILNYYDLTIIIDVMAPILNFLNNENSPKVEVLYLIIISSVGHNIPELTITHLLCPKTDKICMKSRGHKTYKHNLTNNENTQNRCSDAYLF